MGFYFLIGCVGKLRAHGLARHLTPDAHAQLTRDHRGLRWSAGKRPVSKDDHPLAKKAFAWGSTGTAIAVMTRKTLRFEAD